MKPKLLFRLFFLSLYFFCSCNRKDPLFVALPQSSTGINFSNSPEKHKAFGILYFLYYFNGGGVAIGDINNDGLPDIYFTANRKGGNKLYLNKGNFKFEDITEKAGVAGNADWSTGVTMADVNGDGLLDIYVCCVQGEHGLKGHNELFINNGNGTFTESAAKYGLALAAYSGQAVFFDYDHDGDLDCFVLNQSHYPNENVVDTSKRRQFDPNAGGRLFRNDLRTTGKFTDVSSQSGIIQSNLCYGLGLSVADLNNDGWDDIYVGNDFHENDYCYINNGNGTFTESGAKHFGHYSRFSMGNDIADYNNDGQLDIMTVDMLPPDEKTMKTYGSEENPAIYKYKISNHGFQDQVSRNCLQRNNGDGVSFSDVALINGVSATDWSWCPLFADFDNDGQKDLFVSSGIVKRPTDLDYVRFVSDMIRRVNLDATDKYDEETVAKMPDGSSHPFLFKGKGDSGFEDVSREWGTSAMKGYFNGAAYADLNNDGKLDLVVNCIGSPALVLKNEAPMRNYLTLSFEGEKDNRFGIGAKAYVFSKGKMQYQQLMLTRGFQSSSDTRLHFGLDSSKQVDSLLIVWPDQAYQVIRNVSANRQLVVEQKDASGTFKYTSFFPVEQPILQNVTEEINCGWKHRENDFNDFGFQYLLPHKESTRGPKIAVCDVNHDGLDDFYACGAKGQPGVLIMQQKDGSFKKADQDIFGSDSAGENVDAAFFDVNGDGSPDLYVAVGGNEYEDGNPELHDHLYINDGKGHFREASGQLPSILKNKSCVAVADADKNGTNDIFVGGLADARKYGYPQSSYLLLNDGKGNFTPADTTIIDLNNLGMVTSALFADLNNDGWPDLVVAGEWMPIKVFINHHGKFSEQDIPNSTGLWQTVFVSDVNRDGKPDLMAGNWGHNCKLWAGKNGPVKLYIKDFDHNGSVEQLMCYTIDGKEYTFLGKDELERQLPVLKKYYLTYSEVAGKDVQYMFYDLFQNYIELKAETLGSSCFMNDGSGNFRQFELPAGLQLSPVFSFVPVPHGNSSDYLAAGNFYGVIPYEGKYDALFPTIFSFDIGKRVFKSKILLPDAIGEIRDAKWIKTINGAKLLAIARNNDSLLFYKLLQPK